MLFIDKIQVDHLISYQKFLPFLKNFLSQKIYVPDRSHFNISIPGRKAATLLTMPAWKTNEYIGVKIVCVHPDNVDQPSIHGSYLLMNAQTGQQLCWIDGLALTLKRTAAVSALASSLLNQEDSQSMLMIGTGNLSGELIKAHAAVRALQKVWIWGRNYDKATDKAKSLEPQNIQVEAIKDKDDYLQKVDLISCATLSEKALITGHLLKSKVYVDLVGSFKKSDREADDACLRNANIFVDCHKAREESGDIYLPLKSGVINDTDILADLCTLCRTDTIGPLRFPKTVFKSVGFAAPDLAAAVYLYQKYISA